jgi:branched-chain amino acid transport system permease protein
VSQALQLTFDGIVIGMLYAVVGLGVVIVFRTTNVLNFSQGAVATVAGYLAWTVTSRVETFSYGTALLVAVVAGGLLGLVIGVLVTFVLRTAPPLTKSVATLGVFLILGWVARVVFGDLARTLPRPFDRIIEIGDISIGGHGLFVIVMAGVALAITFWLLERTRLGLAMRALAQDEATARTHGVRLARTTLAAWAIASALGAASGVFVGSFIQVDHSIMTTILIQSIAALVVGGFGTASGAVVGGLALGVVSSLIAGFASPGYKNTFVFLLILVVLVVRPNGLVGRAAIVVPESGAAHDMPPLPVRGTWRRPSRLVGGLVFAAVVAAIPFLPHPFSLRSYSVALAVAVAVISLSFFMGYVGEISLGHGALVTVGGYATGLLLSNVAGLDFGAALVLSALAAGLVGGVLGLVTLRLSGVYLGIATLALSFVVSEVALQLRDITGGAGGLGVPAPTVFGLEVTGERPVYYMTAAVLALVMVVVSVLIRSPVGQRWVAVRDSPLAAETNGVAVKSYKILSFAISSAVAGIAGSLLAVVVSFVAPFDYGLFFSVYVILAVILGGAGSLVGAVLGAAFISLMPVALSRTSGLTDAIFGLTLLLLLILLPGGFRQLADPDRRRRARVERDVAAEPEMEMTSAPSA